MQPIFTISPLAEKPQARHAVARVNGKRPSYRAGEATRG